MTNTDITKYFLKKGTNPFDTYQKKKDFKRKIFGLCGRKTVKSINQLADILINLDVIKNNQDGKKLIHKFNNRELYLDTGVINFHLGKDKLMHMEYFRYNNDDSFLGPLGH